MIRQIVSKPLISSAMSITADVPQAKGCPFSGAGSAQSPVSEVSAEKPDRVALTLPPYFIHFCLMGVVLYVFTPVGLVGVLTTLFLLHALYQLSFYVAWVRAVPDNGVSWLSIARSYALACCSGFRGIIIHNYKKQRVKTLLSFPRSKTAAYALLGRPQVDQMLPATNPITSDETNDLRIAIRDSFPKDIKASAAKRIDQMIEENDGIVTPKDLCKMHASVLMDTVWNVDLLEIDPEMPAKYYEIIRFGLLEQRMGKLRYFFGVVLYLHFNILFPKAYRLMKETERMATRIMRKTDYIKQECGHRRHGVYTAMVGGALLTSIGNLTGILYEGARLGRLPDEKIEKKDFIDEILRVYSSIPRVARNVEGIHTFVSVMPTYEDNSFNHRRFSLEDRASANKAATFAFATGRRQCPAMGFIYKTVYSQYMSHLSENYTISLANQHAHLLDGRPASLAFSKVAFRLTPKAAV